MPDRCWPAALVAVILLLSAPARAQRRDPERLTLEQAVARALARNPDVLVAAAEVRRAEALLMQTRSLSLPTLFPSGTYTRLDATRTFMGVGVQSAHQFVATTPFNVPLFVPAAWAQWAHAIDDRRVAELGVGEVRRQIAIAVANAYLDVVTARATLDLTVVSRDNAVAHAEYTRQQAAAGAVSELDAVRAQEQVHTAQAQLEASVVALTRTQEALGVLVAGDRPVDAATPPRFELPARDEPQRRADILWLVMRQRAARNQFKDSFADFFPSLTISFTPLFTQPPTFIQPRFGWQLQVNLVIPLYDGGLRAGARLARGALWSESSDVLQGQLRAAYSDIRLGHEAIAHADARVRETRSAAQLARRALEISTLRYRQGATTNIEVIDAERQARQADLGAVLAEASSQQIRLDLLAAAGEFP